MSTTHTTITRVAGTNSHVALLNSGNPRFGKRAYRAINKGSCLYNLPHPLSYVTSPLDPGGGWVGGWEHRDGRGWRRWGRVDLQVS